MKKILNFIKWFFAFFWSLFFIMGVAGNFKSYNLADYIVILIIFLLPFFIYFHLKKKLQIKRNYSPHTPADFYHNYKTPMNIKNTFGKEEQLMKLLNFFKKNELKRIAELEQDVEKLKSLACPEAQQLYELKDEISSLEIKKQDINTEIENLSKQATKNQKDIDKLTRTINDLKEDIEEKKSKIIWMDEETMVQEFGLYKPQYDFASALDYKEELAKIRTKQKQLIKDDEATSGFTNWEVNGSAAKGRKMVKDTQKLLLRAFNSECDGLIAKVKYTNFDTYLDRIYKSSETVSKLGSMMGISITQSYLDAKVKELRLAFEYQQKKQEEKEALREARAAQREATKLQKEIEMERKKFEKEQTHYETALLKILKALHNEPENQELINKKQELENHLTEIEHSLKDIDYREANQKAGYVYIISNIGAFGPNVYKIGMTRRLDPQERIDELSGASVPFRFDVHAMIFSDDAPALEAALHRAFEDKKINMVNNRKEFFRVTLDEIKDVVRKNFDKTVEFIDVADAEQYRISQKMKGAPINTENSISEPIIETDSPYTEQSSEEFDPSNYIYTKWGKYPKTESYKPYIKYGLPTNN